MNRFVAEQLDGEGALYVTKELFAHFYLGFGSSYPNLMGAVPYLFEQSSTRGLLRETEYDELRYDDKIGQQARVGLAVIRAGQARRAELQAHLVGFYDESRQLAANDPIRAYVFSSSDRARLANFVDMLNLHEIEMRELSRTVRADGRTYEPGEAFIVVANQTHYRIIKGLFQAEIITDRTEFYDVSGWTQPLAWDLDYSELRGRAFSSNLAGNQVESFDAAAPTPERSDYSTCWSGTAITRRARSTECSTLACVPLSSRMKRQFALQPARSSLVAARSWCPSPVRSWSRRRSMS